MKKIYRISEQLLAFIFLFGAVNGLLLPLGYQPLIPATPNSEFATVLAKTSYLFIPQKTVELLTGSLLLSGKFRFASLITLCPVITSILLYHLFDDRNILIAFSLLTLYIIALSGHQRSFAIFLKQP